MRLFRHKSSGSGDAGQKGVTLIEQVVTLMVISLTVLAWLNVFKVSHKGSLYSKNNLRAQNLALSKLEDMKNGALQTSLANAWVSVTQTAMATRYATPTVARLENKDFTWTVSSAFANVSFTTVTALPAGSTTTTNTVIFTSNVTWKDLRGNMGLTLTGYVSNMRQ